MLLERCHEAQVKGKEWTANLFWWTEEIWIWTASECSLHPFFLLGSYREATPLSLLRVTQSTQSPTICSIKWCISSHVDLEHVSTSSLFPHISVCNAVRWAAVAQGAQGCWGPYCPHPHGTHRALVQCYWTSWVIVVGIIHDALLAHFIEVSLGSCRSSGTQLVDIHRAHFYCRNTQFSNCSLKNEVAFSCLNEKCMFSLTFWQLHCKTEQHHAWANRAWGSARLLSSLLFELVLSSSRVNSFLGKKGKNEWSDGSVLPAQCWRAVNALCFLYSVPADCELCRWGQTLRKRWVFA